MHHLSRTAAATAAALIAAGVAVTAGCQKAGSDDSGDKGASAATATRGDTAGASRPVAPESPNATVATSGAPDPLAAPPDVAAPPADAKRTANGVAYKVLKPGAPGGAHPQPADTVKVHYTGWTTDGKRFDSSRARGEPATFPLRGVIAGWTEGLQVMVPGEETRFWIPEELAYKGRAGRPQGMLVFDVELLEILAAPEVPQDVAAPPAGTAKTAKGVFYRVLQKGTGTRHPTPADRVTVHYSGWTTDGKMFDSSIMRGQPATFGLGQVIPGWTDGVQTMVEGEKTRLWIPEELAYKGAEGPPKGMLVFDIELIKIH